MVTSALKIEAGRMRLANGGFDTNNRYVRKVANPVNKTLSVCRGPSIAVSTKVSGSSAGLYFIWRWQVGAAVVNGDDGTGAALGITAPTGFNTEIPIAL